MQSRVSFAKCSLGGALLEAAEVQFAGKRPSAIRPSAGELDHALNRMGLQPGAAESEGVKAIWNAYREGATPPTSPSAVRK